MALPFPNTHYACPCTESYSTTAPSRRTSQGQIEEQRTFNPHDPRAAYALNTIDRLLFCDECVQIRCSRCVGEEIVSWYCPNCLFEVPSSTVRGEGNRCARSCYDCPSCTSSVVVTVFEPKGDRLLRPDDESSEDSYILACQYCDWTTLDIGVTFTRPTKITEQLNKLRKARSGPTKEKSNMEEVGGKEETQLSHDDAFDRLIAFYNEQLAEISDPASGGSAYSSPANLARIMSLYGGLKYNALKKRGKAEPMREAVTVGEGFSAFTADDDRDGQIITKMADMGWSGSASVSQRLSAPVNHDSRQTDELWPVATPLRTKRGKRCRTCRQFIARTEQKVVSTRYKIRILAINNIVRLSSQLLHQSGPSINPSFVLRSDQSYDEPRLQPHVPQQYILTLRNPIFETVKVTLATPATTPGPIASRVTILCPSFAIGPAGDVWDDALSSTNLTPHIKDGGRQAAMASLTGRPDADRQPEAGKVWEKTRNSTSVVLEVVPGALKPPPSIVQKEGVEAKEGERCSEDDDVLEVPIYVRLEWMADPAGEDGEKGKGEKEPRELAYWAVLGLGRIAG